MARPGTPEGAGRDGAHSAARRNRPRGGDPLGLALVTAIAFGLCTAVAFAASSLIGSRAVRMIGPWSLVAWMMIVGLVVTIPITLVSPMPEFTAATTGWWILAGAGNVTGLVLANAAFRVGKVGVITPILACEGAIAALLSAMLGESLAPVIAFLLMAIVAGVVITGVAPDPEPLEHERPVLSVVLATAAALGFGSSLFATGFLAGEVSLGWLLLPQRLVGAVFLFIPLLAARRLRITRIAVPLVIAQGVLEVVGFTTYSFGAQDSVAVASVCASQFAPIAAVMAYVLFRERLGRLQVAGVVLLVASVTALSVASAVG